MTKDLGDPPEWERALGKAPARLDENTKFEVREDIYAHFFTAGPTGQDYFKQANTKTGSALGYGVGASSAVDALVPEVLVPLHADHVHGRSIDSEVDAFGSSCSGA